MAAVISSSIPAPGSRRFSAPARVNLIGEHTDYTGGLVLPMAIPFTTEVCVGEAVDGQYTFSSENFPETRALGREDRTGKVGNWTDYSVGVLRELQAKGIEPPPFAAQVRGDVPLGAGVSSSASLEVATAMALLAHAQATLPPAEIALLCQRAENDYVQSPCGIMDQFVITNARAGYALLLHTRDLAFELLPMNRGALAGCVVVIANSGVRHSIAGGDYGLRRRELEAGQAVVLKRYPALRDLGDATLDQLSACEGAMSPESFRRCRHIISENGRVVEAAAAMQAGDPHALGSLMTAAHGSERDDFECSVEEVDFLVDTANALKGCYGARLTGGGFGGCTVNLVEAEHAEAFSEALRTAYRGRFALEAKTYVCEAVDGAVARNSAQGEPC